MPTAWTTSRWSLPTASLALKLPATFRQFDYNTISDVIVHIRYNARQGVDTGKVKSSLDNLFQLRISSTSRCCSACGTNSPLSGTNL
jgi:Tc toxin complex TcA C-terminal TcB-binding domain